MPQTHVLIDFSLTIKAATLKFISGHGSAISSAKEGKSGSIYNLVKLFGLRKHVRAFHESPDRIYTDLTCINPLNAYHRKLYVFVVC